MHAPARVPRSVSPIDPARAGLKVLHYHGAADHVIATSLALAGLARLADAGFEELDVRVEPGLGHAESPCSPHETAAFAALLAIPDP
jgi:fermentation-respiration switch protein FrsA (DUF1100 family)